ncbi:MAG TPA: glycosyltransferase [Solirubrobacterales bacterium]
MPSAPRPIRRHAVRDQLRALYVGRLQREKRVEELLHGLAVARSLGTDVTLTVVGGGPMERSLRSTAGRLGVATDVSFVGRVSAEALDDIRDEASLFCISSRSELQCCSILEAMACALPIVGARYGAIPETAPDHRVGRLYTAGDARALGMTFHHLANDCQAYRRYSEGALKQADAHSLEATVSRLQAIYSKADY